MSKIKFIIDNLRLSSLLFFLLLIVFINSNFELFYLKDIGILEKIYLKIFLFSLILFILITFAIKNKIFFNEKNYIFLIIFFIFHLFFFVLDNPNKNLLISYYLTIFTVFFIFKFIKLNQIHFLKYELRFYISILLTILYLMIYNDFHIEDKLIDVLYLSTKYYPFENFLNLFLNLNYNFFLKTPYNQKYVFLLLNLILIFSLYKNTDNKLFFLLYALISIYLLLYSNFYCQISIIILNLLIIFKKKLIKNEFLKLLIFLFVILIGPIIYNSKSVYLIHNMIDDVQYFYHFDFKKQKKVRCKNFEGDFLFTPDFYQGNKNIYKNFAPKNCIASNFNKKKSLEFHDYQYASKNYPILTFEKIGYLSRSLQLNEYLFSVKKDFIRYLFIGIKPSNYYELIKNGNFTHNAVFNLTIKYGLFFTILILFFIYRECKTDYDKYVLTIVFLFSQSFDDYLIGNRIEISMFFWFLLALNFKKNFLQNEKY